MPRPLLAGLIAAGLAFSLACGGFVSPEEPPPEEVPTEAPGFSFFQDQGSDFARAGATQGLEVGSMLTLLGPPIAGTSNRQIVGSATVSEVWEDLARVERQRWNPEIDPQVDVLARRSLLEDAPAIEALPALAPPEAAPTAKAGTGGSARSSGGVTAVPVELPADLRDPVEDRRIDALVRYEPDPQATAWIVEVMKRDSSYEVRRKAWRVVRARWKRGTGSRSEHEAAAVWLAKNGALDLRVEAIDAIGSESGSLSNATRFLDDSEARVRGEAAKATAAIGARRGQQAKARAFILARLEEESDAKVRKQLHGALEDL